MRDDLHLSRRCSGSNTNTRWTFQPGPINTEYTLVHLDEYLARSVSKSYHCPGSVHHGPLFLPIVE